MTENKLTDKEIIKGLEHCKRPTGQHDCDNCPYVDSRGVCTTNMLNDTLDLINRQQAEIEKQKRKTDVVVENYQNLCDRYIEARAEAIKEFAERLREKAEFVGIDQEGDFLYSEFDEFQLHDSVADVIEFLSKIAIKEMVGDDK